MAQQLADNAILTAEEFQTFAGVQDDEVELTRDQLVLALNTVSDLLESHLGRKVMEPPVGSTTIEEIFDGTGSDRYFVREGRIQATPAPELYRRQADGTWGSALTSPSYLWEFSTELGEIYFLDGNKFTRGRRNWKLVYRYGWARTEIPGPIRIAALRATRRLIMLAGDNKEGLRSESGGGLGSTTYNLDELLTADDQRRLEIFATGGIS